MSEKHYWLRVKYVGGQGTTISHVDCMIGCSADAESHGPLAFKSVALGFYSHDGLCGTCSLQQ